MPLLNYHRVNFVFIKLHLLNSGAERLLNCSVVKICDHLLAAWFSCLSIAQSALETLAYFARIQIRQPDLLVCMLL